MQPITTVSICTPTYNRRPFIPYLTECIKRQTYPLSKIEWVVVDDGTDPVEDLVAHLPFAKYIRVSNEKMPLGKKRNYMHECCMGDIIVYMDDDDYYPPERVAHAVDMLKSHPQYRIAGSSEMHMYFKNVDKLYQCGPYGAETATAATFAFWRSALANARYEDTEGYGEEPAFLRSARATGENGGSKEPVLQLDPQKTILVISHPHNSLNKEYMLLDPEQFRMTPSRFQILDFIRDPILVDFYVSTATFLLNQYDPGKRENKPQLNLEKLQQREKQIQSRTEQRLVQQRDMILSSAPYCQMKTALENKIAMLERKLKDKEMEAKKEEKDAKN